MAKNNTRPITIAILIAAVAALFFFGPLSLNVLEQRDCTFETPGGSCVSEVVIPADREASSFTMDLDFFSVPETTYGPASTPTLVGTSTTEDDTGGSAPRYEDWKMYLYRLPSGPEADNIRISVTIEASCDTRRSGDDVELMLQVLAVKEPYDKNTISFSRGSDSRDYDEGDLYVVYDDSRGERNTRFTNAISLGTVEITDCRNVEVNSGVKTLTVEWKNPPAHNNTNELVFWVIGIEEEKSGFNLRSTISPPSSVTTEFKRSVYPTDVSVNVGSVNIQTYNGVREESITTDDFASVINSGCQRRSVSESCTVPVTFRSATIGAMDFKQNLQFNVVTDETPVFDDPITDPITGDVIGGGDVPRGENWFTRFIDSIKAFFAGVFTL